jgi:hypothetical protein
MIVVMPWWLDGASVFCLAVIMGMNVDEAGRDEPAGGIGLFARAASHGLTAASFRHAPQRL